MRYVDPDGRKIIIDSDDEQFVNNVNGALEYLSKSAKGKIIIEELQKSDINFFIRECIWLNTDDRDKFFVENGINVIEWNAFYSVVAANGNYNSPAICLLHELVHAFCYSTDKGKKILHLFEKKYSDVLSAGFASASDELAVVYEISVSSELGEVKGRKRYLDLMYIDNKIRIRPDENIIKYALSIKTQGFKENGSIK